MKCHWPVINQDRLWYLKFFFICKFLPEIYMILLYLLYKNRAQRQILKGCFSKMLLWNLTLKETLEAQPAVTWNLPLYAWYVSCGKRLILNNSLGSKEQSSKREIMTISKKYTKWRVNRMEQIIRRLEAVYGTVCTGLGVGTQQEFAFVWWDRLPGGLTSPQKGGTFHREVIHKHHNSSLAELKEAARFPAEC